MNIANCKRNESGLFEGCWDEPKDARSIFEIRKVATTDIPVLVLGESGTGKGIGSPCNPPAELQER
jgi:DNA-binding NtrC family response regulator